MQLRIDSKNIFFIFFILLGSVWRWQGEKEGNSPLAPLFLRGGQKKRIKGKIHKWIF